jgi:hypothetical protein
VLVNERLSAPYYRPQTLASNLAKSHKKEKMCLYQETQVFTRSADTGIKYNYIPFPFCI